jgi:hypothetical protein
VPQAVPGSPAAAVTVAPPGRQVGALEEAEGLKLDDPQCFPFGERRPALAVGAGFLLGVGIFDPGGVPLGQRVAVRRAAG